MWSVHQLAVEFPPIFCWSFINFLSNFHQHSVICQFPSMVRVGFLVESDLDFPWESSHWDNKVRKIQQTNKILSYRTVWGSVRNFECVSTALVVWPMPIPPTSPSWGKPCSIQFFIFPAKSWTLTWEWTRKVLSTLHNQWSTQKTLMLPCQWGRIGDLNTYYWLTGLKYRTGTGYTERTCVLNRWLVQNTLTGLKYRTSDLYRIHWQDLSRGLVICTEYLVICTEYTDRTWVQNWWYVQIHQQD